MGVVLAVEKGVGTFAPGRERLISRVIQSRYRLASLQATVSGPPFRSKEEFELGGLRVKRGEWAWPLGGRMGATVLEFDVPDLGPVEVKLGDRIATGLELLKLVLVAVAAPEVVESAKRMAAGHDLNLYLLLEKALEAADAASRAVSPEHARLLLKNIDEGGVAGLSAVYVDRSGRKWRLRGAFLGSRFLDANASILSVTDEEGRGFLWVGRSIPADAARGVFDMLHDDEEGPLEPKEAIPPEAAEALLREYIEVASALADALNSFTTFYAGTRAPNAAAVTGDAVRSYFLDRIHARPQGGKA